eukprot:CAMPEP_0194345866 /NCGR_PEP_ID=MMETSP0171-20130528/105098_1 /TAXON_ID=218684 /ORGANISM="Corethron pennatum, Strain L29A3" /LENGTH=254 /DNA_ID=CAMNT_0039112909 /DNA_START=34 /DNA_END=799 /DNA_ORIENTATION=+
MKNASITDSQHGKAMAIPKDDMKYESKLMDKDFQKSRDKSKMSEISFGSKENNSMKAVSVTTNVDEMVSVTESVLDAALENFNEWYDDICQNGIPIKDDIFETIENDARELAKVRSNSTQSSKQHENIQEEEVKSQEEVKCQEEEEVKCQGSRRFLVLLLLSTTFCVMPDITTKHSLQTFPTNPSVQVHPTNMFELKTPQKTGVRSILKDLFPLRDNLVLEAALWELSADRIYEGKMYTSKEKRVVNARTVDEV